MSTLGALTKSAAAVAIGAAALLSAPAVASAAPFMPDPLANCKPAATLDVEKEGDEVEWEFEGPVDATTDAQVTYLNIGQAGPTVGSSGALVNGEGTERALPGFTIHLVPGGTYDPDGTKGQAATCALGFGFAVTQ
jgi:hypothetical protein